MYKGKSLLSFLLAVFLWLNITACESLTEKGYNTQAIADEMKNREIKRITENQLKEWTLQTGNICSARLSKNLWQLLQQYPDSIQAEKFLAISDEELSALDSLSKIYTIKINKIPINAQKVSPLVKKILQENQENYQAQGQLASKVQVLEYDTLLYTAPIFLPNRELVGIWFLYFSRKAVVQQIQVP